jgi:glycosyltransferase involved in cell wall biosynthesis
MANVSFTSASSLTFYSNLDYGIIIVDDGSPDGTANIAKQLQKVFPKRIILKERAGKLGLGTAYIHDVCHINARSMQNI